MWKLINYIVQCIINFGNILLFQLSLAVVPSFIVGSLFLLVRINWVHLGIVMVCVVSRKRSCIGRNATSTHAKGKKNVMGPRNFFCYSKFQAVNRSIRWTDFLVSKPLWAIYTAHFAMNWSSYIIMQWLPTYLSRSLSANAESISLTAVPYVVNSLFGIASGHIADGLLQNKGWSVLNVRRLMTSVGLVGPALFLAIFCVVDDLFFAVVLVSISMGLSACNSAGHLSNHVDVAPNHAGTTFAISNTIATIPGILCGPVTASLVTASEGRWIRVFLTATAVNLTGAFVYFTKSASTQVV